MRTYFILVDYIVTDSSFYNSLYIQGRIIADKMISLICGNTFYLSLCSEIIPFKTVIKSLIKLFAFAVFVFDLSGF